MHLQPCSISKLIYKKAVEILKSLGFFGGNVNPCFYVKKSAKGVLIAALYIDDNLIIASIEAIDDAIAAIKETGLVSKIVEGPQDCLTCKKNQWTKTGLVMMSPSYQKSG